MIRGRNGPADRVNGVLGWFDRISMFHRAGAAAIPAPAGLIGGTRVATPRGWCPVEILHPGDSVLTFDHGMQTVREIGRSTPWSGAVLFGPADWPLRVPAGALGNRSDLLLQPRQPVLLESDFAESRFGDPFAQVQAATLLGVRGIVRVPPSPRLEAFTLRFPGAEVIFASAGALCLCPAGPRLDAEGELYSLLAEGPARLVVEATLAPA